MALLPFLPPGKKLDLRARRRLYKALYEDQMRLELSNCMPNGQ